MRGRHALLTIAIAAFLNGAGLAVAGNYYLKLNPLYGLFLVWHIRQHEPKEVRFVGSNPQEGEAPRRLDICIRFKGPVVGTSCPKKM